MYDPMSYALRYSIASQLDVRAERGLPPQPWALGWRKGWFWFAADPDEVTLASDWLTKLKGIFVLVLIGSRSLVTFRARFWLAADKCSVLATSLVCSEMQKDREWAQFRHCETFPEKYFWIDFFLQPRPRVYLYRCGLFITPAVNDNASGYCVT